MNIIRKIIDKFNPKKPQIKETKSLEPFYVVIRDDASNFSICREVTPKKEEIHINYSC